MKARVDGRVTEQDKQEIIELSKKHGIYFEKHTGCCTVTPNRPVTRAEIKQAEKLFKDLGLEKEIKNQMKNMIFDKPTKYILKKLL